MSNLYDYQQSIFPEDNADIVTKAIKRIQFAWSVAEQRGQQELYVCFSGGKDSVVLATLCEMAKVPYRLHYNITGIDMPETVYFIRRWGGVEQHWYEKSMRQLIVEKKIPPLRMMRYCCAGLKEHGGTGQLCCTGVRWAESVQRKSRKSYEVITAKKDPKMLFNDNDEGRQGFENCLMKKKLVANPIIDWSDSDIWQFIHLLKIPYCGAYDRGYKRLGCIGCPMATLCEREKEFSDVPGMRDYYIKSFDKMLFENSHIGYEWKNGTEVFDWWLYGNPDVLAGQLQMLINEGSDYD